MPRRVRQGAGRLAPLPTLGSLQKAGKRIVDPLAGRAKLAEGACRGCGKRITPADLARHHLVPRAQLGDDVAANLVPLGSDLECRCHGTYHHGSGARRRELGQAIRSRMLADELAYVLAKKGRAWLDDHYPPPDACSTCSSELVEANYGAGDACNDCLSEEWSP